VSFFDDEGDEPPTRTARPRRPAAPRARSRGAGGPPDSQQVMVRRAVALGIAALILVLIVVGVNGCVKSRAKNALRDYNRDVAAIVSDSNTQVSKPLFQDLANGAGSPQGLYQNVNSIAAEAQDVYSRAKALSVPGDMRDAQYHLLLALSLRLEGVNKIANDVPNLSGNDKRAAVRRIAADMRLFLASDVLFAQRIDPYILQVLGEHDISGQTVQASQFLPDDTWLDADSVGDRLGVAGATATGGAGSNTSCPGICGHGLVSVAVGGATLQPGTTPNRVTADATSAFTVTFQNQGTVDEYEVPVTLTATGSGSGRPITSHKTVDTTKAGQTVSTSLRLGANPPANPVRIKVTIGKVAGEKTLDNNSQTYLVIFQ
jgi:hypothetical protein